MRRGLACLLLGLIMTPALAQSPTVDFEQWLVEWPNTRPRDPAVAVDGRIWFVGQSGDYAAVFVPETQQFTRFDLPAGSGPHTVFVTRDQQIWYTGNRAAHLGRIDPDSGAVARVGMPHDQLEDPHTLCEDARGRLWFTAQWANQIGRYDRDSGEVRYLDLQTPKARPYGIAIDDQDIVWAVLLGTHKLARITPDMRLTEIELPRGDARPRRIAITSRGIWYVDYAEGYLGLYDPASGRFKEWRTPAADRSAPYAMAADDRGRIWFVETYPDPNRFVGFDPQTETYISIDEIPGASGAVRHMTFDAGRDAIWFGTDTNRLMRADLPD